MNVAKLFGFSLLMFAGALSAHEARVNPDQRDAIRRRLEAKGCLRGFESLGGSATRGISRGVTRGMSAGKSETSLPAGVEQYSNYFSEVIPAELDLPYGKPGDPKSHMFFRMDPHEGPEKIRVQEELGLRWPKKNVAPTTTPTWIELAKNYREALKQRNIDPDETFIPTLVLYRDLGSVKNEATGKVTEKREYLFIDPLTEKFPDDMSQWKVLDKDVQFNIPFAPIFEAMQKGKFPLLDAVHDVSHFVSFLRFPEFAKAVRKRMKAMGGEEVTRAFKGREYWLTEALSVLDPNGFEANQGFLRSQKRPTAVRTISEIEKELSAMSEKSLVDYSYRLAKHFESQLRDISGGNSNAAEKWYYLSEGFGMRAEDLVNEDISKSAPLEPALAFGRVYFNNQPITLNANPKTLTNETATFSFNNFIAAQKLIALSLRDKKQVAAVRTEAIDQLIKFTSRAEALLTQKPFNYEEWADAFLQPDLPQNSPLGKALTATFPNQLVPTYYLGKGAQRPKKDD